jgi:hypothetical protein
LTSHRKRTTRLSATKMEELMVSLTKIKLLCSGSLSFCRIAQLNPILKCRLLWQTTSSF